MTETAEVGIFTKIGRLIGFSGNGSKYPKETSGAKPSEPPVEAKDKSRWPAGRAHVPPFNQDSGMPGIKSWSPGPGMIPTGQAKEIRQELKKIDKFPSPPPLQPPNPRTAPFVNPTADTPRRYEPKKIPFNSEDMNPARRHIREPLGHLDLEEQRKRTSR